MRCFVTVGTTSFNGLIEVLNREDVRELLASRLHVSELVVQFGRGTVEPAPSSSGAAASRRTHGPLPIRFCPSSFRLAFA